MSQSLKTETIQNTITPIWDQTLVFDTVLIHGDPSETVENPPKINIEIFDQDNYVSMKIIEIVCSGLV